MDLDARDAGARDGTVDAPLPFRGSIRGIVVDETGRALAGALVRFGGRPEKTTSAADGRFSLEVLDPPVALGELALTAGKMGYRSAGVAVSDPSAEQRITLKAATLSDNADYTFKSPDDSDATPDCRHCHINQVKPWQTSAHAGAARNPRLYDVYNGTASGVTTAAECTTRGGRWLEGKALGATGVVSKCYVALGGVLSHLNASCGGAGQPTCDDPRRASNSAAGPCADCHAPGSKGHVAGATDLNRIDTFTHEKGIHCDFCHKISRVTVNDKPGVDGAIALLRPSSTIRAGGWSDNEIMFGPLSDVIVVTMGNVYQPQFARSELCSACHQWLSDALRPADKGLVDAAKWPDGLPLQDTYYEWSQSPAAVAGTQCQHCHMPAKPYETAATNLAGSRPWTSGVLGWPRSLGEVREHSFAVRLPALGTTDVLGPGEPSRDALREPIALTVTPTRSATTLTVSVTLHNRGAGHSIPTGTPSRQMLLLVSADVAGTPLRASGGSSIPGWVGAYLQSEIAPGKAALVGDKLTLPAGQSWPSGATQLVVRFVWRSGAFASYPATRWFAGKSAAAQGMPIDEPRAEARITAVNGQTATLDHAPTVPAGARVLVGDALPDLARAVDDTLGVTALGGVAGWAFGKLMRDRDGNVGVPFFMATDIASDNRIPADAKVTTRHVFDASSAGAQPIRVRVLLLYRKYPWDRSRERGWTSVDAVRNVRTLTVNP